MTTIYVELVGETCWACGVVFGLTSDMRNNLKRKGQSFYCPRGCCIRYGESDAEKLHKQLVAEQASHDRTRADRDAKERSLVATRGLVTRIKNRVGNGVCPCCNRTFQNLLRHMKTKHPAYKAEAAGAS